MRVNSARTSPEQASPGDRGRFKTLKKCKNATKRRSEVQNLADFVFFVSNRGFSALGRATEASAGRCRGRVRRVCEEAGSIAFESAAKAVGNSI
jgi:hypothetical protein